MMTIQDKQTLYIALLELRNRLAETGHRLVLAESCTAGLVAAELGQIPGISNHFCGSMVVYRNDSKAQWLQIPNKVLSDPAVGPVSESVTSQLAQSILNSTPEATIGASITGHLGPNAPANLDGIMFCCVALRNPHSIRCHRLQLQSTPPMDDDDWARRRTRQAEAAMHLIQQITQRLDDL